MKTIYRYKLAITDEQTLPMLSGAIPLHLAAGWSADSPAPIIELWCAVDTELPMTQRRFRVVGTGHPADGIEPFTYIGTVIHELRHDRGVWHVFDLGEAP